MVLFTPYRYSLLRTWLERHGYGEEIAWSEGLVPPDNAEWFASEVVFVIVNSGMKAQVADGIWTRVKACLQEGRPVAGSSAFRHPGKARAIDDVWSRREALFGAFLALPSPQERLAFLGDLPWVGPITKYHLAKNFGLDVAKPDRWLARVAALHGQSVEALCAWIAAFSDDRVATVDTVIWRAANLGILKVSEAGLSFAPEGPDAEHFISEWCACD